MMLVGNQSSLETLMVSINRRQFRVVSRMWHTLRKTHLQPVNNPQNCHTHDMLTPRAYMRDYSVQPSFPWLGHHQIPSKFPQGILVAPLVLVTVRATGHKTPGESSVNITVCNYNTTHLQENPQRLGWGSWRDVLYYILGLHSKCQGLCDWSYTSVFKYYFSNTWTGLGRSGALLCSSRVKIELSPVRGHLHFHP